MSDTHGIGRAEDGEMFFVLRATDPETKKQTFGITSVSESMQEHIRRLFETLMELDDKSIEVEMDESEDISADEFKRLFSGADTDSKIGVDEVEQFEASQQKALPHHEEDSHPTGSNTSNMTSQTISRNGTTKLSAKEEAELNNRFKDIVLERQGTKFVIPDGMSLDDASHWIDRKKVEEEATVAIDERIQCYVLDGAYAFMKAIARIYGWSNMVPTPGFWSDTPPAMIALEVGIDENGVTQTVQVPWGRVIIPGIEGFLSTGFSFTETGFIFCIKGEIKQKSRHKVKELAQLTREMALKESVYRGQAIRVKFQEDPEQFSPVDAPKFMDISRINEKDLVFNDEVMAQIQTSVFNPIEHTEQCRKYKIPLKTGILLEGTFGTGKTLTANHAAKKCVRNGWTYIYLENVKQLKQAILFAKQYQPALIFAEDIDRVVKGERTEKVDEILNTIDGVDTKNTEIMVVLTTNDLENINKAMLRPGRLDAVIKVHPPDDVAVQKLIRLYGRNLISQDTDLAHVGSLLAGQIPASIQEVVERSKRSALTHLKPGEEMQLHSSDLETAAKAMLHHLALLNEKPEPKRSAMEQFGDAMGGAVAKAVEKVSTAHPRELEHASNTARNGTTEKRA